MSFPNIVVQKSFFLPQRRRDAEGIISLRLCASAGDHSYYAPVEKFIWIAIVYDLPGYIILAVYTIIYTMLIHYYYAVKSQQFRLGFRYKGKS
jgi:hypothetical protein